MKNGLIHVYTGEGKGKTTAAIGQGIRCIGHGNYVYMIQFLKKSNSGEIEVFKKLKPFFEVYKFEKERGFFWNLSEEEIMQLKDDIRNAWNFITNIIRNKTYDMIILDEIMAVLNNNLLDIDEVFDVLNNKHEDIEIILTGRNSPKKIMDIASYVSSINSIKHPFEKDIKARCGIEF